MNHAAPTANDPDASPFAFTPINGVHPFLFCRTTLSNVTSALNLSSAVTFASTRTASCYIGTTGSGAFSTQANNWLNTPASATFKKTFNMSISAFRTDSKNVGEVIPGRSRQGRAVELRDGFTPTILNHIKLRYPHDFRKVGVTIVEDSAF